MESKATMGKRISDLRKQKGMTQEQLANLVGVTAQAVSKWENDLSCPDISILPQLADALGVTTDQLLGKEPLRLLSVEGEKEGKRDHNVTVSLNLNRWEKIVFSLLLVGIGVVFLLNAMHIIQLGEGITFWSVLWPFLLTCMGIMLCRKDLSPVSLGIALFGLYMLLFNMGIIPVQYKLTWGMIWPAALILIGLTVLLGYLFPHRKGSGEGFFHVEKGDPVFEYTEEGGFINVDAAFSSQEKKVMGEEPFKGAKIDMSFGNLVVDLTGANIENGATIDADVSFGSLTLRLPASVGTKVDASAAFGGCNCPPGDPNAAVFIYLKGDVSFGKIEVEYR